MASFKNDFGLSGKLGDVIIYQIGNKSYARRTFRANNPKTIKQQEKSVGIFYTRNTKENRWEPDYLNIESKNLNPSKAFKK